jgi:hypothetical protein
MNHMLEAALRYAEMGWPVFPVGQNKAPLCAHGVNDATTDEVQIKFWWANGDANIAVATGPAGLAVLDIDPPKGEFSLLDLEARRGVRFPATLTAISGRGRHLYFKRFGPVGSSVGKLAEGLDIRAEGASVILPPSLHASGKRYRWIDEATPIATFPAAALLILKPPKKAYRPARVPDISRVCDTIANSKPGTRNQTLNASAFTAGGFVAAGLVSVDEAVAALDSAAAYAGLDAHERRATIKSGLKSGMQNPFRR